jgi:vesicle-fusing ATPase
MNQIQLKSTSLSKSLPSNLGATNNVYVGPNTFQQLLQLYPNSTSDMKQMNILYKKESDINNSNGYIFLTSCLPDSTVSQEMDQNHQIAFNIVQRETMVLTLNETILCESIPSNYMKDRISIVLSINSFRKNEPYSKSSPPINLSELPDYFHQTYSNQYFRFNQKFVIYYQNIYWKLHILSISGENQYGYIDPLTTNSTIIKDSTCSIPIQLSNQLHNETTIFKSDFNFEKLGIGGLDHEFTQIFRRAFASRLYSPSVLKKMGLSHVKGLILYGPPGCGKTLIARKISQALNSRPPKLVNGPEILGSYVGQSEANVRDLFADAEKEMNEMGENSQLHIIIFDELDALMKKRGSTMDNTGVHDNVVNQLLSKIDGVDSLNNLLIIGMTNRLDTIDEAMLRPGRFEIHVEIGLPNDAGREQILQIHLSEMKVNGHISQMALDHIPLIVDATQNFTGAELAGLVRSSASYALSKHIDLLTMKADNEPIIVEVDDLNRALGDIVPAYGRKQKNLLSYLYQHGIIDYSNEFVELKQTINQIIQTTQFNSKTEIMSILFYGNHGVGKTALAAHIATQSNYPFIRYISPADMIGMNETQKCQFIYDIFQSSYRTPLSFIILDDIERIIDYTPVGPRFSNQVLQTLLILINQKPNIIGHHLFIIGTTSLCHLIDSLELKNAFQIQYEIDEIYLFEHYQQVIQYNYSFDSTYLCKELEKIKLPAIGIKKLMMAIEMAKDTSGMIQFEKLEYFLESL